MSRTLFLPDPEELRRTYRNTCCQIRVWGTDFQCTCKRRFLHEFLRWKFEIFYAVCLFQCELFPGGGSHSCSAQNLLRHILPSPRWNTLKKTKVIRRGEGRMLPCKFDAEHDWPRPPGTV